MAGTTWIFVEGARWGLGIQTQRSCTVGDMSNLKILPVGSLVFPLPRRGARAPSLGVVEQAEAGERFEGTALILTFFFGGSRLH